MSNTASSVQTGGVVIPAYQAATGALVRALENVASIVAGHTDVTRTAVQLYGYRRTFGSDRGRSEPSDS